MKTMNCQQLGGACDLEFHAETFEKMASFKQDNAAQLESMEKLKQLMQ